MIIYWEIVERITDRDLCSYLLEGEGEDGKTYTATCDCLSFDFDGKYSNEITDIEELNYFKELITHFNSLPLKEKLERIKARPDLFWLENDNGWMIIRLRGVPEDVEDTLAETHSLQLDREFMSHSDGQNIVLEMAGLYQSMELW